MTRSLFVAFSTAAAILATPDFAKFAAVPTLATAFVKFSSVMRLVTAFEASSPLCYFLRDCA